MFADSLFLVLVRYAVSTSVKEELYLYSALHTNTTATGVIEKVNYFFDTNGITNKKLCGLCTDSAQECLGPKVDLGHLCRGNNVMFTHFLFTGKF